MKILLIKRRVGELQILTATQQEILLEKAKQLNKQN